MTALNPLAVQNAALLRELGKEGPAETVSAIARRIGRDESNVRKSIKLLIAEGLAQDPMCLTVEGGLQVAAIDRAENGEGKPGSSDGLPDDHVLAAHAQLMPDPDNARKDWDSEEAIADLAELAESIDQRGLLQNPMVKLAPADLQIPGQPTTYMLDGGERRWRAIGRLIADGRWPAERRIICRLIDTDELGHRLAALAENMQRRNLNPLEKARAFDGLAEALAAQGVAADKINRDIADRVGVTIEHVQQHRSFLKLDDADQQRLALPKDDPRRLSVRDARQKVTQAAARESAWKPTSHPADEQLLLAELAFSARERSSYMGNAFMVGADARHDPLAIKLAEANLISLTSEPVEWGFPGHFTADFRGWHLTDALRTTWPQLCGDDPAKRLEALDALQLQLRGLNPSERFVTPWLNGPFELTDEGQAIVDRQKAAADQRAAAEEQRQADLLTAKARYAEARAAHLALLNAAAETPPTDMGAITTAAAAGVDHPLPWTLLDDGTIEDAAGEEVTSFSGWQGPDEQDLALGQIIVLSVNTAAGLPTPPIRSTAEPEEEQAEEGDDEAAADTDADAAADAEAETVAA